MLASPLQSSSQDPLTALFNEQFTIPVLSQQHSGSITSHDVYDWSSFPIVGDYCYSLDGRSFPSPQYESYSASPLSSPPSRSSPTSVLETEPINLTVPLVDSSIVKKKDHKKSVSFSSLLEIRTHSVILGDHPCCLGGMALECGWSHEDVEIIDLQVHEAVSAKRRSAALRLDYGSRRERLQEATGLTGCQLLQQEYEFACGPGAALALHHALPTQTFANL
jgi:hypothetical protein